MLKKENLSGIFFLSGDKLKSRLLTSGKSNLSNLYGENWVGSHSMLHESHQYLKDWKKQIDDCDNLIQSVFNLSNETFYFRPPYGQRTLEITKYLLTKKQPILLWNIDSQDWSFKINAQEVSSRVIALMLLWRKGIILFHDVHSKSSSAVPKINEYFKNSNVKWLRPNELQ
jgi:peptidoglycan/xylan/chitin deacetylase (PgdA/CDA1 family)